MTKQQLAEQAQSLGLLTTGTKAEIQARINAYWDAMTEAGHDTATSAMPDLNDLHPVPSGTKGMHPVNAALIGGAAALVAHWLG